MTNTGPQLLREGKITMAELNGAVRHVLTLKYLAGMFTNPYQGSDARVAAEELTPAHLTMARSIADESEVLLNNTDNALPLSTSTSKIAVVGPLADDALDQLGPDVPIGYDTTSADLKSTDKIVTVRRRDQGRGPRRLGHHGGWLPHVHRRRSVQRDHRFQRGGAGRADGGRDRGGGRGAGRRHRRGLVADLA